MEVDEEVTTKSTEKMTENNDPIHFILLVVILTVLISVSVCSMCGLIGYFVSKSRKSLRCPLCKFTVFVKDWTNGVHR